MGIAIIVCLTTIVCTFIVTAGLYHCTCVKYKTPAPVDLTDDQKKLDAAFDKEQETALTLSNVLKAIDEELGDGR